MTLVEIVVALVIVAIVAALAIPNLSEHLPVSYDALNSSLLSSAEENVARIAIAAEKGEKITLIARAVDISDGNMDYPLEFPLDGTGDFELSIKKDIDELQSVYHTGDLDALDALDDLESVRELICLHIFMALSGAQMILEGEEPQYVQGYPHLWEADVTDYAGDFETLVEEMTCKVSSPAQVGSSQRQFSYEVSSNTLTILS